MLSGEMYGIDFELCKTTINLKMVICKGTTMIKVKARSSEYSED